MGILHAHFVSYHTLLLDDDVDHDALRRREGMCLGVMHLLLVSRRSIPYLQSIIELGHGDVDWVDATKTHPHLLCYHGLQDLGQNFTGTTDLLVADCLAVKAHVPQLGLRVLFHLTKEIADSDHIQADKQSSCSPISSPQRTSQWW